MFGHYAYQYLAAQNGQVNDQVNNQINDPINNQINNQTNNTINNQENDQEKGQGKDQDDDQNGKEPTSKVSVVSVTASSTATGPISGFTTMVPSSQSTIKSASTSSFKVSSSLSVQSTIFSQSTTSTSSILSKISSSSSSVSEASISAKPPSQTPEPAPTTVQITEPSTPVSVIEATPTDTPVPISESPMSESLIVPSMAVSSAAPLEAEPTSSAAVQNLLATSLEDLPLYIASPTATVPVSVPLLVASSSTSVAMFRTSSTPQPSKVNQSAFPAASESAVPSASSMTSSGKVSIIFGITLLLGAACLLYQLYFRKQRKAERARKLEDNEKQSFGRPGAGKRSSLNDISPKTSIRKPAPVYPAVPAKDRKIQPENHRENPFGNHAEIVVDPINASGPRQIERDNPDAPVMTRLASKKAYPPQKFTTTGPNKMSRSSASTEYSVTSMAPGSMPAATPTSAAIEAAGGPVSTVYRVQLDFSPSMDDELELRSGQLIRVLHEFDDGWAMCLRLDCSEQGVCPRTCLSSRPVKQRSQSNSSLGRPPPQQTKSYHAMPNQISAVPLPTTPQELPALKSDHKSDGFNGPQGRAVQHQYGTPRTSQIHNASNSNNNLNHPASMSIKVNSNDAQHLTHSGGNPLVIASEHSNSLPTNTNSDPIKSDISRNNAPADDYFSFTKPDDEIEILEGTPEDYPTSPHHHATSSSVGTTTEYLSNISNSQKPIPGQAL